MSVELLNEHNLEFVSLKGGCTGSSESTLVKMPHCWKSHARLKCNMMQLTRKQTKTTNAGYTLEDLRGHISSKYDKSKYHGLIMMI